MSGGFFRKVINKVKSIAKKVMPVMQKVAPFVAPLLNATPLAPIAPFLPGALDTVSGFMNGSGGGEGNFQSTLSNVASMIPQALSNRIRFNR